MGRISLLELANEFLRNLNMKFIETKLKGAYIIELEPIQDERGYFARGFCVREFEKFGLSPCIVQCNISYNKKKGTLRGMHYQKEPFSEIKTVRCFKGAIFDVIIDLRENSSTFMQWQGVELTEANKKMLYIPKGFAHGFITLEDETQLYYHVSEYFNPKSERGIRYNDSAFNIKWPIKPVIISGKDLNLEDFKL
jgi:dTDP-4-dehydrorhamnose 3,5-epimerase